MVTKLIKKIDGRQAMIRHVKVKMADKDIKTNIEAVADALFMIAGVLEDNTKDLCQICELLKQKPGSITT